MNLQVKFSETGQIFNSHMGEITVVGGGQSGQNGATFTPFVSEEGVISWTNDRGLKNPAPVNIKGEPGEPGKQGEPGYTPVKGIDYYTEADKAEMVSAVISALPVYGGETLPVYDGEVVSV